MSAFSKSFSLDCTIGDRRLEALVGISMSLLFDKQFELSK